VYVVVVKAFRYLGCTRVIFKLILWACAARSAKESNSHHYQHIIFIVPGCMHMVFDSFHLFYL